MPGDMHLAAVRAVATFSVLLPTRPEYGGAPAPFRLIAVAPFTKKIVPQRLARRLIVTVIQDGLNGE